MAYTKQITPFITSQMPGFVHEYHPDFVTFVRKYYEWAETSGNALERLRSLPDYINVDKTLSDLLVYFQTQYSSTVPVDLYPRKDDIEATANATTIVDIPRVVKNIKRYFRAKGTPNAVKYLLKVLYGLSSVVIPAYDREDYTTTDKTRYFTRMIDPPAGSDIYYLKNQKITGSASGTTAFVEGIREYKSGHSTVYELEFSNIDGTFTSSDYVTGPLVLFLDSTTCCNTSLPSFSVGDYVYTSTGTGYITEYDCLKRIATISVLTGTFSLNQTFSNLIGTTTTATGTISKVISFLEPLKKSITSATIVTDGDHYAVGNLLSVNDSTGIAGVISVKSVGSNGEITGVTIRNPGVAYTSPTVDASEYGDGRAVITLTTDVIFERENTIKKYNFPLYTYIVKIAKGLKEYKDIVRGSAHPSGFKMLGYFSVSPCMSMADTHAVETAPTHSASFPMIEHYLPYTIEDVNSIGNWNVHPTEITGIKGTVTQLWFVDELVGGYGNNPYKHLFRIGRYVRGATSGATARVAYWGAATLELEDTTASSSSSQSSSSSSSNSSSSSTEASVTSSSSSSQSSSSSLSSSSSSSNSSSSLSSSSESSSSQSSNENSSSSSSTLGEENAVPPASTSSSSSSESFPSADTQNTSSSSSSPSSEHEFMSSSSPSESESSQSSSSTLASLTSDSSSSNSSSSSSTAVSNTSSSSDLHSESSSSSSSLLDVSSSSSSSPSSLSSDSSSTEESVTSSSSPSSSSSSSSSTAVSETSSSSTGDDFLHLDYVYQGTSYANALANPGFGSITAHIASNVFDPDGDPAKAKVVVKNIVGEFNLANPLYNKDGKEYRIRRVYHHLGVNTITGSFVENEQLIIRNVDDDADTEYGATLRAINKTEVAFADMILRYFIRLEEYAISECGSRLTSSKFGNSSSSSSTETSSSTEASVTSSSSSNSSSSSQSTETSSSESSSSQSSDHETESLTSSSSQSTGNLSSSSTVASESSSSSSKSSSSTEASVTSSSSSSSSSPSSDSSSSSSTAGSGSSLSSSSSTDVFGSTSSSSSTAADNETSQSSASESSSSQSSFWSESSDSSNSSVTESQSSNSSSSTGIEIDEPATYGGRSNVIISDGTTTKLYGVVLPVGMPIFESIYGDIAQLNATQLAGGGGLLYRRVKIGDSYYYRNHYTLPETGISPEPVILIDTPIKYEGIGEPSSGTFPIVPGKVRTEPTSFRIYWDAITDFIFSNNRAFFNTPINYVSITGSTTNTGMSTTARRNRYRVIHEHAMALTNFIYGLTEEVIPPFDVIGYVVREDKYLT